MKSKQLVILILLAAILGSAVWHLKKESKETWSDTGGGAGGKVIEFPINDVAKVTIQTSAGATALVRKENAWAVQDRADYPANDERVVNLLRKLWDLKTVQEVKAGPSQFGRLELAEPLAGAGMRVDFTNKDGKVVGALLLGKKHVREGGAGFGGDGAFPTGRYVRPQSGSKISLVSDTLDDVDPKPESWLKRDFIKIENPSSVTLVGTTDAQKWKLTREAITTEWKLAGATGAENLDAAKVSQFGSILAAAAFADVLNPDVKPAETGLDKPTVITFETFDRFTYVLKVGKENGGNYPVTVEVSAQPAKERTPAKDEKPEDKMRLDEEFKTKLKQFEEKLAAEKKFEGRPFLIAKATMDQMIKDRTALLAEKKTEPAPGAPPVPAAPGSPPPAPPRVPISVTTPPIAAPAVPNLPVPTSQKLERTPTTATTPPVTLPPALLPKPEAPPVSPEKPTPTANPPSESKPSTAPPSAK